MPKRSPPESAGKGGAAADPESMSRFRKLAKRIVDVPRKDVEALEEQEKRAPKK